MALLISFVTVIRNWIASTGKYTPYNDLIRKTLEASFDKINRIYSNRGIKFIIHNDLRYIAIEINKTKAEAYRKDQRFHISQLNQREKEFKERMDTLKC